MFCIADLMPSCQGGETCFKYLSAFVFLTTLIWNNVVWSEEKPKRKNDGGKKPSPQKTETNEAQCSGK